MCVSAKAIFKVPRVTMNGGSLRPVTSRPLRSPKPVQAARPRAMDSNGLSPWVTARRVITMVPNAITAPADRSMSVVRKRSVRVVKKIDARMSASSGPKVEIALARARADRPSPSSARLIRANTAWSTESIVAGQEAAMAGSCESQRAGRSIKALPLAPAVGEAELGVFRVDARLRFIGYQSHACVGVARHTLSGGGEVDARVDTERCHLKACVWLHRHRRDFDNR